MQNRSNPVSGLDTDRQALDVDLDPDPVEKCQFDKIKLHKTNVADPGPFWSLHPGWVKSQDPGSGTGMKTQNIFPRA